MVRRLDRRQGQEEAKRDRKACARRNDAYVEQIDENFDNICQSRTDQVRPYLEHVSLKTESQSIDAPLT